MTNINSPSTEGRQLLLATDGACLGNPGPGGWAVVIHELDGETVVSRSAIAGRAKRDTTNNRSELKAAVEALKIAKTLSYRSVTIVSDSQYVTKGASEYLAGWKAKGWRKSDRKPVLNQDLWESLDAAAQGLEVNWQWARGHAGEPMNDMADRIANDAAARVHAGKPSELLKLYPEAFANEGDHA
jgi:ribonuclease HI